MNQLQTNLINLQAILDNVNNLPEAGKVILPELSNPAISAEVFANKELIDANGNKIVGTFAIDNELTVQDDLIAQIQTVIDSLPEAGSGGNDGTNAELITGTISLAPNNDTMDMSNMVYYTDLDGLHEDYMNIFPYTFNCIKNSIVHLEDSILKESSTGINTNPFTFGNSNDFTYKHYVIVENNNFNIIIT